MERFNRTSKLSLRCTGDPSLWYDHLPGVSHALRNTPKGNLCHASPCELVFEESMRLPGEFLNRKMSVLITHRLRIILANISRSCDITSYANPMALHTLKKHFSARNNPVINSFAPAIIDG